MSCYILWFLGFIMFCAQWKYYNAIWNIAYMQIWPQYHSIQIHISNSYSARGRFIRSENILA